MIALALRFATVGVINTLVGYAAIFLCMWGFGMDPIPSNVLGYATGLVVSFVLNRTYTFRSRAKPAPEALRFMFFFALAYGVNLAVLIVLIRRTDLSHGLAQVLAGVAYFVVFFLLSRFFVFKVGDHQR